MVEIILFLSALVFQEDLAAGVRVLLLAATPADLEILRLEVHHKEITEVKVLLGHTALVVEVEVLVQSEEMRLPLQRLLEMVGQVYPMIFLVLLCFMLVEAVVARVLDKPQDQAGQVSVEMVLTGQVAQPQQEEMERTVEVVVVALVAGRDQHLQGPATAATA